jgi:adenosylmethionine-8-amino-7-oxononanoate aminotransferase
MPDLMALAKGLTGGYLPLAATLTTEKIFNAFLGHYSEKKTFFHGHSYTGNQLSCAAALANLEIFAREKTLHKLEKKILFLSSLLAPLSSLPNVKDVRQCGFIAAMEVGPYAWEEKVGIRICSEMRKRGVLTRPLGNVVPLIPPYCVTQKQLEKMVDALAESVKIICRKDRSRKGAKVQRK